MKERARRSFLKQISTGLAAAAAAMASWALARFAVFGYSGEQTREFSRDVLDKLQPGEPVNVATGGAWLLKIPGSDYIIAFDDRCPHLGCRHKWNPQARVFECPCHGSLFDSDGKVLRGPATRSLPRLSLVTSKEGTVRLSESSPGP